MAEEAAPAATKAMEQWFAGMAFRGYGDKEGGPSVEDAFGAGFEAGIEWLRGRVLEVWDMGNAWIPGSRSGVLADALGVPRDRTLRPRDDEFSKWLNS